MRKMIKAKKPKGSWKGFRHLQSKIYGSLNGTPADLTQALTGVNVDFVAAGPTYGMIANPDDDTITVKTPGAYDVTISLTNEFINTSRVFVQYSIFINEVMADASLFSFFKEQGEEPTASEESKTITLNLNANDVISVRPIVVGGPAAYYRDPTLVVKEAEVSLFS
ncbi:hypothetical protein SAMN04488137_3481 [Fictibacillus solisalsi]|uniref:BclA C-terminal domain-containing protein n=1 Tax=Fictibacillus solisalsi TaxID=459525 RepID=A0A1G9YJ77_9BACL|nr:hypothetical protein [Fictibacillus solisalsi]SDN09224.1 hypothetical protein SAMN04488137_3481 [Fictibacillus solisalsi]